MVPVSPAVVDVPEPALAPPELPDPVVEVPLVELPLGSELEGEVEVPCPSVDPVVEVPGSEASPPDPVGPVAPGWPVEVVVTELDPGSEAAPSAGVLVGWPVVEVADWVGWVVVALRAVPVVVVAEVVVVAVALVAAGAATLAADAAVACRVL